MTCTEFDGGVICREEMREVRPPKGPTFLVTPDPAKRGHDMTVMTMTIPPCRRCAATLQALYVRCMEGCTHACTHCGQHWSPADEWNDDQVRLH